MKVNTALCFVLAGAALALRERRALRLICAGIVAVVSALSLAEYVTGADFGIDQLWVRDPGDAQTVPGRMAQVTGISFILASLSLLLVGARARAALWAQQAMALTVGALGMVALLGYAYDVRQLYGLAGFSSMALHTATALVLLAAGLVCARTDGFVVDFVAARPGGPLARRLLPGAILLPAIIGWLRVQGSKAGLFEPNFGTGLFAITMILGFTALVWWTARTLNRADAVRRETETQLRNQAELMDHAHEALIVREPGGAIRSWNRGAEALYGWPAAEALGREHTRPAAHRGCAAGTEQRAAGAHRPLGGRAGSHGTRRPARHRREPPDRQPHADGHAHPGKQSRHHRAQAGGRGVAHRQRGTGRLQPGDDRPGACA